MRGQAKGNSPLHKDHPEQACRRTVINRLCKMIVKASDDSDLVMDLFDETDDLEVAAEIDENANKKFVDLSAEVVDMEPMDEEYPPAEYPQEGDPIPAAEVPDDPEPEKSTQPKQVKKDPGF
jgi:recombination protein RecT